MPRIRKTEPAKIYICARHNSPRRDARLVSLFLCDDCLKLFVKTAFNGRKPEYENCEIEGYCAYCLRKINVKQRFFYLCTICERVVRSYGIEKASSSFLLRRWKALNKLQSTGISIIVNEPSIPMTYDSRKAEKDSHVSKADFLGIDDETEDPIFAIEMKTGRNAISKMSAFQLDVSDCDDILAFYEDLRLPTYLFHVEVVSEYFPPTELPIGRNAWWMNIFEMEKAFKSIRMRQREQRPAAYFNKKCFHKFEEFPSHILSGDFKTLTALSKKKTPKLYILKKKG